MKNQLGTPQRVLYHYLKFVLVLTVLSNFVVREPRGVERKVEKKRQAEMECISRKRMDHLNR